MLPESGSTRFTSETAKTLPVDFHSFRRAFSSAAAVAGFNAETAMRLAHQKKQPATIGPSADPNSSTNRARPAGLEPATRGLEGRRSIQLSYGRLMTTTLENSRHLRRAQRGRRRKRHSDATNVDQNGQLPQLVQIGLPPVAP